MSRHRQHLGEMGEELACRELRRRGYAVLARRYRTRAGEIDIVARHGDVLVFVEVKARASARYGTPTEAITAFKRRRIGLMATDFLARHRLEGRPCRFDVVAISLDAVGQPLIEVIAGAFELADGR